MCRVSEAAAQVAKARIAALEDETARLSLEVGCRPTIAQLRTVQWQLAALRRNSSTCLDVGSSSGARHVLIACLDALCLIQGMLQASNLCLLRLTTLFIATDSWFH